MSYQNMVRIAETKGDSEAKLQYLNKLKEQLREVPLSFQAGLFFLGIGMSERTHGYYQSAQQLFEAGLKIFQRLRNKNFQNTLKSELGHTARQTGDINKARKIYTETLANWRDLGNRAAISHQLECFGLLALTDEEPQRAVRLFAAAEALRERINSTRTDYEQVEYEQAVAKLRSIVAPTEFNSLWTAGRSMTMEQAIELALS
jgi:tetratricopeptide (TPR) repeat protein